MSMIGLDFPLGFVLAAICMVSALKKSRYDFLVMVVLALGGYNLSHMSNFHFDLMNVMVLLGVVAMLILRKPPILKRVMWAIICYAICLSGLAMMSDESMTVQYIGLRNYLSIVFVFFPFIVFSGEEFDIMQFFRVVFLYSLWMCSFYAIDSIILGGAMLMPRDPSLMTMEIAPTFYSLYVHPITNAFLRRWPLGLYPLALCLYPIVRYFKVSIWQWALMITALLICRTFTVTMALVVGALVSVPNKKKVAKYVFIFLCGLVVLYFIDGTMGVTYTADDQGEHRMVHSTLRIKSQVDQMLMLDLANADEEDLAMLGTGRGAQILPKLDLIIRLEKEWTGLGFLNRDLTKNKKYLIENDLYGNPEQADEVAIGVESAPFDIFLTIGYIGLIVHALFWVWMWLIVRKLKYSGYFASTAAVFVVIGIGGPSLNSPIVLLIVSLAFAAVVMDNKRELGFDLASDNDFFPDTPLHGNR